MYSPYRKAAALERQLPTKTDTFGKRAEGWGSFVCQNCLVNQTCTWLNPLGRVKMLSRLSTVEEYDLNVSSQLPKWIKMFLCTTLKDWFPILCKASFDWFVMAVLIAKKVSNPNPWIEVSCPRPRKVGQLMKVAITNSSKFNLVNSVIN